MPTENAPAVFEQHPDTLIKRLDRNPKPAEAAPAALDPAEVAKEEATLEELKQSLPDLLFGEQKKKEPAAAAPATPEPPKVEPAAPAAPAEPAKVTVRKAPDALEIARETGRAIAENLRSNPTAPIADPNPAPKDPTTGLSSEDKDNYELFEVLSKTDPEKYKNKHTEFLAFVNKVKNYQSRWEKANAGKAYDPSDSEHEDFYSANQPQYVEADLEKARIRRETRREVESQMSEREKAIDRRMQELEAKTVGPEVARQAATLSETAVSRFVAAIPDENLRKAATESLDKLPESDPLAYDVLNGEAATLRQEVTELHNIIHRNNYYNESNPIHNNLSGFINHQEQNIKKLPADKQVFEGKTFATRHEWGAMTPAQRQSHWMLGEDDVVEMLTRSSATRAVKVIESERKRLETQAAKYGYTKPAASATPPVKAAAAPAATPAPASTPAKRPSAPAGSEGGALPPTTTPAKAADATVEKNLVKFLW